MNKKFNNKSAYRIFAKDIRQWIDSNILENRFDGISVYKNSDIKFEAFNNKEKQCGICMNSLVVYGIDFSLKCLHAVCWCCIIRLRFLLKNKECPFCKNIIDFLFMTSNPRYFDFIIDDSFELSNFGNSESKKSDITDIKSILDHPKKENIDIALYNEEFGVYYESLACRWYLDRILEYRCWFPKCRPVYSKIKNTTLDSSDIHGKYKNIKSLGEHLFREHHVKCCYVCIEKRKTMLLPEHFLYGVKDLNRHMRNGEMFLKPPILPHISCPICKVWCLEKEDFSDHVRNEHFSCYICEEKENNNVEDLAGNKNNDSDILEDHFNISVPNDHRISKISYVYKDYTALRQHWKSKHYPCDHEDCMFIVFENESELIFHKATHHSLANRRGNITVPIALTSYRQQNQRRFRNETTGQTNNTSNILNVSTPSLCILDDLSNKIISKIKAEKSLLWRLVLIYDLAKCIQIINDELMIELGLEEKCRDFNKWSLNTINTLFSKNQNIISVIQKLGCSYINKEISSFSFITEMIQLLWANSQDISNINILQTIKKQFKSISTSPNISKFYFSPVPEPFTIFEDTLRDSSGCFKKIPSQYIDQILINDANWSILCSDVVSMILISLILGIPDTINSKDLLKSLLSIKNDIQDQKIYILSNTNFPRFTFANLQNSINFENSFFDTELHDLNSNKDNNKIKQKFVKFEKLIKPDEITISSRTSFLESLNSILTTCWPKLVDIELDKEFILDFNERGKIIDKFTLMISSQTSTEINALSSLYQHTSNFVSSANTIERILGLRAPYYRLAVNISDSNDNFQDSSSNYSNESLSHKQWLNICTKVLNKICIYDIEIIMLYCQSCVNTLNDPNFIKKEEQRTKISQQVIEVKPTESNQPKTVNANSEIISYKEFYKGGLRGSTNNNSWSNQNYKSSQNSVPKTVIASSGNSIYNLTTLTNSSHQDSYNSQQSYLQKLKSEPLKKSTSSKNVQYENKSNLNNSNNFPSLVNDNENKKNHKLKAKSENLPKWTCVLCTHMNPSSINRCQICSTKK